MAEKVSTETIKSADMMADSVMDTPVGDCKLCLKKASRYTCPRCNVRYCSSECYKSQAHAQCSETFYRDCFMTGLKEMRPEKQEEMMKILQRQADEKAKEEGEEDVEDLADRLEGIDIERDTQRVWERLTETEKAQFQSLLKGGELGKLVEPWTPWWDVQTLVSETDAEEPYPTILEDIPKLNDILKGKTPAGSIPYSVVNVLYGYCYILRLYNGDLSSFGIDICQGLLKLSEGFRARKFASTSDVFHASLLVLSDPTIDFAVSRNYSIAVIQDVCKVIQGGGSGAGDFTWILSALSDLHALFTLAIKQTKKKLKKVGASEQAVSKLKEQKQCFFVTVKKIEFFLSYIREHGGKVVELVPEIEVEYCTLLSTLVDLPRENVEKLAPKEDSSSPKTLIEEV